MCRKGYFILFSTCHAKEMGQLICTWIDTGILGRNRVGLDNMNKILPNRCRFSIYIYLLKVIQFIKSK